MTKGIDVSKYQGTIDWNKVKHSGVNFAIIRAGYGKYSNQKDPMFEINYTGAKAAGVKVGAYHYSYAKSVEDARQEAQVLLEWLRGKQFEYPIALDVEEKSPSDKGKQFVSDVIMAFCEMVENAGYYVCVYANKHWCESFIDDDCIKKYDIWVAQWCEKCSYNGTYGLWQYTSDGCVDGIDGRVDMNESYKDYQSIITGNSLNGFAGMASEDHGCEKMENNFTPRMMVSLYNTPLFVSATAKKPATEKSGTFYIYDGVEVNGRYRITNTPERALKKPASANVTGYVNKADLR